MAFREIEQDEFVADLMERGWSRDEAEAEWKRIQAAPDEL